MKLFTFDVTLKELMNLGECSKRVTKLDGLLTFLRGFWYSDVQDVERWDNTRVGTVESYLDEEHTLCLKFTTRFSFHKSPEIVAFLKEHLGSD